MLTINVTKEKTQFALLDLVEILINEDVESLEFDIITDPLGKLILCLDNEFLPSQLDPIYVADLFKVIQRYPSPIQIILNFKEPNLESRALFLAEEWDLKPQIKFSGQINPSHFSLWERLNVIYDIKNCLPNIEEITFLKQAHIDVVNYFCNKYQVKMIRIHMRLITEEVVAWCDDLNLKLSVSEVETIEVGWALEKMSVEQISVNDSQAFFKPITY